MKRVFRLLSTGPLATILVLAACQDSGPTAPPGESAASATVTINGVRLIKAPPDDGLQSAGTASAVIGPSGGQITEDGGTLTVPPGALQQATRITIHGKLDGLYKYRFEPSGLQFQLPATLTIKVNIKKLRKLGFDPSQLGIAVTSGGNGYGQNGYDDADDGDSDDDDSDDRGGGDDYPEDWEVIPATYDPVTGTVSAQVYHFSLFALCQN